MDGESLLVTDGTTLVNWLTDDIDNTAEGLGTYRHLNGVASVLDRLTTNETFSRVKSDGSYVVATQMLSDFKDETVLGALNLESIENGRKFTFELDINDGTDNLGNFSSSGAETTCEQRREPVSYEKGSIM